MNILLLTDCQSDFVTGSMSVKKRGKECVEKIKIFINRNKDNIEKVIFKCIFNLPTDTAFKRNGGDKPMFCVKYTPGACIEPTILKLLWRLKIPYEIITNIYNLDSILSEYPNNDIVISGMNGNTTIKTLVKRYWNQNQITLFWPGILFSEQDTEYFKWLREHTEGILEVPKRDKKRDLFVQRF